MNDLFLIYVKPFYVNNNGDFEYQLFFSETPDVVWGVDWDVSVPNSILDLTPEKSTYSDIINIKSSYPFKTIEQISCYSMEYAVNKIVALSWVDIDNLEDYPPSRCVLHFGDSFEEVKEKLSEINIEIEPNNIKGCFL